MTEINPKERAAQAAIELVKPEMTLGLGTGSTAAFFIEGLAPLVEKGYKLKAVATSVVSANQARALGIELIEPDETTRIDLAVDGADEVDPNHNLIKGGGGALFREKIVAYAAQKFVVIADSSKRVVRLGAFDLPVEIDQFSFGLTVGAIRRAFESCGVTIENAQLRTGQSGPFITDNGNFVLDIANGGIEDPAALHDALINIPGVIETGLFCAMTDLVLFGNSDGSVTREAK